MFSRLAWSTTHILTQHYAWLLAKSTWNDPTLPTPSMTNPFGKFQISYPTQAVLDRQTLAEVAEYEMAAVKNTLKLQARIGTVPGPF